MTQRVLVTAGAFGIGREICRAFLASGAKVFTCDIDAKALDTLAKELPDVKSSLCDILAKRHTQQPPGPKRLIGFRRDRREAVFLIQEQQEASSPHITSDKLHNLIFS